jgi:hypothetical protein
MTGPDVSPDQSFDRLYDMSGPRHAQREQPKYAVGAAFVAACEAIGVGDAAFGEMFCEELMRVIRREKSIDDGQTAVVKAWKARVG